MAGDLLWITNFLRFFIILQIIRVSRSIPSPLTKSPDVKSVGEIEEYLRIDDMIIPVQVGKAAFVDYSWPDAKIPYVIDISVLNKTAILANVMGAMYDISEHTCIQFTPAVTDVDTYWIKFWINPAESQCSATLGWRDIPNQEVNLNTGCYRGAITHELLHTLGLLHEQTRNDRDDYVEIKYENMLGQYIHNFQKDGYLGYETSYYGVPYDFDSIMHYPANAFSVNTSDPTKNTIVPLKNSAALGNPENMGMTLKLTPGDIEVINTKYNCITTSKPVTAPFVSMTTPLSTSTTIEMATSTTTRSSLLKPFCKFPLKPPFCILSKNSSENQDF